MRSLIFVALVAGVAHAQPAEAPADAGVAGAPVGSPVDSAPVESTAPSPDAAIVSPPDAATDAAPHATIDAEVDAASEAAAAEQPVGLPPVSRNKDAAWLFVGGALAFATTGAVLAYAANSSENDIADLYVSIAGKPPVFDSKTQARYYDLLDEGHRYEHLSWASFGVAGAMAVGAAIYFWRSGHEMSPIVTPSGAGVAVKF